MAGRSRKVRIIGMTALALIAAAVFSCAAVPEVSAYNAPVRVGYYENEVFQEGAAEDAVKTGYAYEYYRKLSEYTGWNYEYVYGSFSDLYQKLLDGDVDLLAGLAYRDDRASIIGYPSQPMGNEAYSLVKHSSDDSVTTEPATLEGKKIGVLDSALADVLVRFLQERDITAEVMRFSDYEDVFRAFDTKEIDVLAAEGDGASGRDEGEVLYSFGASDYYLCVSISRQDLLAELNSAQAQLNAEEPNYLTTLKTKYYSASMSSRAFSVAEKQWLSSHSEIKIGYLENYLPYSGSSDSGEVTGMIKDMVPDMLRSMGMGDITVSYRGFSNYDAMIDAMRAEEIDAAFPVGGGLYYSEENGLYQTSAVISSPTEVVFRSGSGEEISSFAVNENNRMQFYYIRTNFPNARVDFYQNIDECLKAVLSGDADATTLNGLRADDILRNSRYRGLSTRQMGSNDDRCFGIEIGNEGLLKLLNRGINILGTDYMQNLAYKYTGELYTQTFSDVLEKYMGLFIGIGAAVAAVIIYLLARDMRRSRKEAEDKEIARLELEEKNSQLEKSREALSEALSEAENANRAKTVFLNNMSHDMRTPMNAIVGFTSLAENSLDDPEKARDYLGRISVSSGHLLSLINDVLDMSRIESGNMTLEEADVDLPDLISDLQTIIRESVNARKQELNVSMNVNTRQIVTDRLRLSQVLLNILNNASKFTPEGGQIDFSITEMPSEKEGFADFEFSIRDNGIGMSEEFQKTLFQAFTRERNSTVSGIQGTGLGMAITKNIVDMMGGDIRVFSKEGEGSEFIVTLSCRKAESTGAEENEQKAVYDFSGKRVLLAEDNEMNRMIATAILEEVGFEVDIACDGTEAVEKMEQEEPGHYDAILMDIQMPQMNGYEASKRIRAIEDPRKAGVPIVAVTANAFDEDRKEALDAGMNGHLAKPYDVPLMMETLRELLGQE